MNFLLVMQLLQVFLLCPYIQVHEFPLSNAITTSVPFMSIYTGT